MSTSSEPVLQENKDRFVLFPIQHNELWDLYKKAENNFWTAEEIDFSSDFRDWENKLTGDEKHFIKHVLGFFVASAGIINENLAVNFLKEVQWPEARCFYGFQLMTGNIHSETCSLLIDSYIKDQKEKESLLHAVETIPSVGKKAEWAQKFIQNGSFAERLVAFAAVQSIFFSGSSCSIFWLKNNGLMPGLSYANDLISRDGKLHCDFAALLYSKLKDPLPKEKVAGIIAEAVAAEQAFVREAIPVKLIGMNADQMCNYVEFAADRLLISLGSEKKYNTVNPFGFMETTQAKGYSTINEKRVAEFQKTGVQLNK
jgi:ribonucleoside-diphosphate reductase beta chain